jgi:hypothetical protein
MLRSYSQKEGVKDFECLVNCLPTGQGHGCASHNISYGSSYSRIREGSTFSDWPTEIRTDYNLSFSEVNYHHQAFPLLMKIWQKHDPFLLSQLKIYAQARNSILNALPSYFQRTYCHTEFGVFFTGLPRHQALRYMLGEYHAHWRTSDISITA